MPIQRPGPQNVFVTITYTNGTALEAIVLSHNENEIRAIAPGDDEVLVFTRIHGVWISEDLDTVAIGFEWERRPERGEYSEGDCICSKELAAHLIQTLFSGSEEMVGLRYVRSKGRVPSASPSELRAN